MKRAVILAVLLLASAVLAVPVASAGSGTVKVIYSGSWSGAILDDEGSRSVDGSGTRTFSVRGGMVSVTFQKMDGGSGRLTVQIIDGSGNVIAEQSTTAEYGVVGVVKDVSEPFGGVDTFICFAVAGIIGLVIVVALYSVFAKKKEVKVPQQEAALKMSDPDLCSECFSAVPAGSKFCPGCGRVMKDR